MPEKIRNLVTINTQAALTRGVQLSWYGDPNQVKENERLASGYIFSSGAASRDSRTAIDIFTRIRETLNTSGTHNVFTIIAQYGHGKSHFALVLANYFGRTPGDPVLERIIRQIESCTDTNTAYLFRAFKTEAQKPQLVVRLSGHDFINLRQGFMQALRRALDENEQSRSYQIGSVSQSAAKWLRSLTGEKQQQAEEILGEHYQTDLGALIGALEAFDSTKESIARDLSIRINGVAADFGADLNLQEVINKVISDLCVGADAPFHKLVILFDELGIYAEKWCYNRMAAGDLAPQQILEACDSNKGRMALVAFIQREIPEVVKGYNHVKDEFRKWTERFPPETTFRLESSLEQVIQGLLTKNRPSWDEFARDNMPRIDKATIQAWQILPSYQNKPEQWTQPKFTNIVGVGSFPLHPITTGLLCNLTFTQGARTIIEVVTTAVQDKGDESASLSNGELNFVLPTFLVDEFAVNFEGQEERYSLYKHASEKLGANASAKLYQVLKALFLFEVGSLKRYESQSHAQVLAQLCGLREDETTAALRQLDDEYGVIRYSQARREYEFTGIGLSRNEIRQLLIRQTIGQPIASIATKLESMNMLESVQLPDTEAVKFKADHGIGGKEWHLAPRLMDATKLSADSIKRIYDAVRAEGMARGVVIYVVSSDSAELEDAQERAEETLNNLRIGDNYFPIVLAIPTAPINVEQELLIHDALKGWSPAQKEYYGEAYNDAVKDSERRLNDAFAAYFRYEMMRYYVAHAVRLSFRGNDVNHLDQIASRLFAQAFTSRVPAMSDLMRLNSTQGNSKVADVARYLLKNDGDFGVLDTAAKNLATAVLHEGQDKWGVLTARNRLQEPKGERVARSWQELEGAVLEDRPVHFAQLNERLQAMPFGHDDYTLTLLYAAWIGLNKNELRFFGSLGGRDTTHRPLSLAEFQDKIKRAKEFIKWLGESRVQIQRPGRVSKRRATEYLKQLETVNEYEKAAKLVNKFDEVIATLVADDEVRGKVLEQVKRLGIEIKKIHEHTKTLQDLRGRIERTHNVRDLLAINDSFPKSPETFLIYDESPHIEIKKFLNERIEAEVKKQTQQPLKRREEYEAVKNQLKEMKDALRQSGRQDLEQLCTSALERIDAEYEALKAKEKEAAIINEVESFKAGEASLAASRKQAAHIEELLNTKLCAASENTRARIDRNLQQVNKRISTLEEWIAALPQRIEAATELSSVRALRDELVKHERDYADTPELHTLNAQRELLEKKEQSLLNQAARQAARQAQVSAYMRVVEERVRRAEKAKEFEAAIQDLSDACAAASAVPEDIALADAEQASVNESVNRATAWVGTLFHDLVRPREFSKDQEFLSHQAALERALSAVERFDGASAEWQSSLADALRKVTQELDAWRAEQQHLEEARQQAENERRARERNQRTVDDTLRQTKHATSLREIRNALAVISDARSRLEPSAEDHLARLDAEHKRLEEADASLREWVNVTLPREISAAWIAKDVARLRQQVVKHESLCADDPSLSQRLADARVSLDKRSDLLNRLSKYEQQTPSLPRAEEILTEIDALKAEFPDSIERINAAEQNIRSKLEVLREASRRNIETWLTQFEVVHSGAVTAQQAGELLRKLEQPPAHLDSPDNELLAPIREKLEQVRSQDIANRIIDNFRKLTNPQQRAECLLQLTELCKADGLPAEYVEKLINALNLREASNA